MSYLVFARKYRPQCFSEVYAQEHITRILQNAIELNRIAHAYLFTGPRGVGKTSMARIFAKSLNCVKGPTITPCNECQNCLEITRSVSADVIEIDGASNTGVDDIRDLQKELMYSTSNSQYKIYIIDEVHMLSKNAFNALLKTLEEPPENVIFIFATTEPHKVLATIISRCQRFDFKRIPISAIVESLSSICQNEKIKVEEDALFMVAKKADGSLRDALSLLDQLLSSGEQQIFLKDVISVFGIVPNDVYRDLVKSILQKDPAEIIRLFHSIMEKGSDIQEFINGFMDYIRSLILLQIGIDVTDIPQASQQEMKELAASFQEIDLLYLISMLIKTKSEIKKSANPILIAEITFVKLARLEEIRSLDTLISELDKKNIPIRIENKSTPKTSRKDDQQEIFRKTENLRAEMAEEAEAEKPDIEKLTQSIVEEHFKTLAGKISKEKPFLSNYIGKSKIGSISDRSITLIASSELALKMLSENREIINRIISDHFNLPINTDYLLEKKEQEKTITNPDLKTIREKSPQIADFIEETDSEF